MKLLLVLIPVILAAQTAGTLNLYPANPAAEQSDLNQAIAEANGSPVDLTRALEQHLKKYPNSPRRAEMEASLYRTALEGGDGPRIIVYGEKLLAGKPDNELEILDHVIRALLAANDTESARKALAWSARYETGVMNLRSRPPEGHTTAAQWADLGDRAFARSLVLKARATGNLGKPEEALALAEQSWRMMPGAEAAQEIGRWAAKLGRDAEAINHYADAAMIDDSRYSWAERERVRKQATELYTKLHGSDQGLGDVFLHAWDRDAQALRDRTAHFKTLDRNYGLTSLYDFTLPATGSERALDMNTLRGKTVVLDFWATWCLPCVAQHPVIERVKQKYAQSGDVVFLSLDMDDDHALVPPFLKAQKWEQRVYLEAGLAGLLNVTSLPTILVIDPSGKVYSRILGFVNPEPFESMLGARIDELAK